MSLTGSSSIRRIPATGIGSQSGRIESSYRSSYTAFSSSKTARSFPNCSCPAGTIAGSTVSR